MRRAAAVLLTVAVLVITWSVVSVRTVSANDFLPCHDNTTASNHTWTHGDPVKGIPGDPLGGSGYYYLSIKACGPIVEGTVYSPGDWDLDISPDLNHDNELAAVQFHGSAGRVYITNAVAGNNYRLRVANISTHVQKDYAELNSGSANDGRGGCGGPGTEVDPNTGGAPVEPPPTPGLPDMGCGPNAGAPPATPPPTRAAQGATATPAAQPSPARASTPPPSPSPLPSATARTPGLVALAPGTARPRDDATATGRLSSIDPESSASGTPRDEVYALIAGLVLVTAGARVLARGWRR